MLTIRPLQSRPALMAMQSVTMHYDQSKMASMHQHASGNCTGGWREEDRRQLKRCSLQCRRSMCYSVTLLSAGSHRKDASHLSGSQPSVFEPVVMIELLNTRTLFENVG